MSLDALSTEDLNAIRQIVFHVDDQAARERIRTTLDAAIRWKRERPRIVFMPADHTYQWWSFGPSDAVRTLRPDRDLEGLWIAWQIFCNPRWLRTADFGSANDVRNKIAKAKEWVRAMGCELLAVEIGRIKVCADVPVYRRDRRRSPVLDVGMNVIE